MPMRPSAISARQPALATLAIVIGLFGGCGGEEQKEGGPVAFGLGISSLAEGRKNLIQNGYGVREIPLDGGGTQAGADGESYRADAAISVQTRPDGSLFGVDISEYFDPKAREQVAAVYEKVVAEKSSPLVIVRSESRLYVATDATPEAAEDKIIEALKAAGEKRPEATAP